MSEVVGLIKVLGNTEIVGSAGTFKKRTLVIETDEQYKQFIPIDFVQDKCDALNDYKVGDSVKVSINIRGNEYNGKYYVSLSGWRIEKQNITNTVPVVQNAEPVTAEVEADDLPF